MHESLELSQLLTLPEQAAVTLVKLISAHSRRVHMNGGEAKGLDRVGQAVANSDPYRSALRKKHELEQRLVEVEY